MSVDPKHWKLNAKLCAENFKALNDSAERGFQLVQDFNFSITKNETEMQYLLQVVLQHRKKFPHADVKNHF
jgi:hypothetical protein